MRRLIIGLMAVLSIIAVSACEFPDQAGEFPTLETIDYGSCYVDTTDPYNPVAGRDVTVEIKNNMPTGDPDNGAMVISDSTDYQGNDLGLAWNDWSDEDGQLFYTNGTTYNVVEPGQTATITYFQSFPEPPTNPGASYAAYFLVDQDADSVNETDVGGDDVVTLSWLSIDDLSCDVCPPGQTWNPAGPYCEI